MTASAVNNHIEAFGDADGGRYLQCRASVRYISNCAFDLRGLVANDDIGGLQHAPARSGPLFIHGKCPASIVSRRLIGFFNISRQSAFSNFDIRSVNKAHNPINTENIKAAIRRAPNIPRREPMSNVTILSPDVDFARAIHVHLII